MFCGREAPFSKLSHDAPELGGMLAPRAARLRPRRSSYLLKRLQTAPQRHLSTLLLNVMCTAMAAVGSAGGVEAKLPSHRRLHDTAPAHHP